MTHRKFLELLKNTDLNKKEFAEKTKLAYSTVGNWSSTNNIPDWVESWLENYIKAKNFDTVVDTVEPFVGKNPPKR